LARAKESIDLMLFLVLSPGTRNFSQKSGLWSKFKFKITPPCCFKFFKVGLLLRRRLINKHNMFIRVDCQIEIGVPESAIFETLLLGYF